MVASHCLRKHIPLLPRSLGAFSVLLSGTSGTCFSYIVHPFFFLSFRPPPPLLTLFLPISHLPLISLSLPTSLLLPILYIYMLCYRLNFGIPLSCLPRESRLCFTLHGLESTMSTENPWHLCPIAWVTQRLFNSEGVLIFGPQLLGLWAGDCADPLDSPYSNLSSSKSVLLEVVFEESDERVMCDDPPPQSPPTVTSSAPKPGLPPSVNRGLKKMADRDRFSRYVHIPIVTSSVTCTISSTISSYWYISNTPALQYCYGHLYMCVCSR